MPEKTTLEAYAKLLMGVGLNVQKGQTLVISAPVDCADFARICASAAYDLGCREVVMNWSDDFLGREKLLRGADEIFDEFPQWRADFYNAMAEERAAWLSIAARDPEAMSGTDPDRIRRSTIASGNAIKSFYNKQMASYFRWCVASIPTAAWAKKVFPGVSEEEAMSKLWDAIFDAVRINSTADPVAEWREHCDRLAKRVDILNGHNFKSLKYKNSLGTDFTVELPENHVWAGGSEKCSQGIEFCANMPTEEVFTAPKRDAVNGVIYASKPLIVNGDIADNFSFTVENGKITKVEAEKGQTLLETAISVDEGASYFGEVALVPYDSPISNSGILFYNTLFDENASCHFAFGEAYPKCVKNGENMTAEELKAAGLNSSLTHNDFMVGTADLSITGVTKDGQEVPVFVNGNFAF